MLRRILTSAVVTILAVGGFVACSDESPVAPPGASHTAPAADHMGSTVTTNLSGLSLTPFTFRAPLDRFRIQQADFAITSEARKDIVIQQSLFAPGAGIWHTHPGPSFVYVLQGELRLDRFTQKDGCTETPVYGPGNAYFEEADQVHRAVVTSVDTAVVLVTRFNIPVGAPFTIMAADPGC